MDLTLFQEHFWSLDETVQHLQPIIVMQIWDNDIFNPDDFLGQFTLGKKIVKPFQTKSISDIVIY